MKPTINPEKITTDNPEATEAWFLRAKTAQEVLPEIFDKKTATEMLKPKRGRPALASPKAHINIRLDTEVVDAFKETGAGWQTRINAALKDWLKTHQL
jgi:uncharacterized protein (DUF4415 family)